MTATTRFAVLVPLAALLIAACGGKDPGTPPDTDAAATARATPVEPAAPEPAEPEPAAPESAAPEAAASPDAATTAAPAPMSADTPTTSSPAKAPKSAVTDIGTAMAPMPGTVTRQTELKAEPGPGARTLSTLAVNTPVTITTRQGGWLRVTSGESRGWVRLLHVSSQPVASTSSARAELEAAARVATGRAGKGNVAVTTGIRGLDEKELREAQPNPEELARLESFGAQPADAQARAKSRSLERRQVPYPPPPQSR